MTRVRRDNIPSEVMPSNLAIYRGEFSEDTDCETFRNRLWGMLNYKFGEPLSQEKIKRIRWHIFPEVRIGQQLQLPTQGDVIPDVVRVMDLEQEKFGRRALVGHRVIHGPAGTGKTVILEFHCQYLAELLKNKKILVLCYNITLAARLRKVILSKIEDDYAQVHVHHFHEWCKLQLEEHGIELLPGGEIYERQVATLLDAVNKATIPWRQYDAVIIDEGQDMQKEWLRAISRMVNSETGLLLLLYDHGQSIYKTSPGLGFTLSSAGIHVVGGGRAIILKQNYRNTREIYEFAYSFAKHYYFKPQETDDDHIPTVDPTVIGIRGPAPLLKKCASYDEEMRYAAWCIDNWRKEGVHLSNIGVLYPQRFIGRKLCHLLKEIGIECELLDSRETKLAYDPSEDKPALMTIYSSKGLEFERVILIGVNLLKDDSDNLEKSARVLYVGMTRARKYLVITYSGKSSFSSYLSNTPSSKELT
jgi:superfamily I DNA/RNA helicase